MNKNDTSDTNVSVTIGYYVKTAIILFSLALFVMIVSQYISSFNCVSVIAATVIFTYPVWITKKEIHLLDRRALLSGLFIKDSSIKKVFWQGHVISSILVFTSFISILFFFLFLESFTLKHWLIIKIDALFMIGLVELIVKKTKNQLNKEIALALSIKAAVFINTVILITIFLIDSLYFNKVIDYRNTQINDLVITAYSNGVETFNCYLLGLTKSILDSFIQGAWFLAQNQIPFNSSNLLTATTWIIFLFFIILTSSVFSLIYAGVIIIIKEKNSIKTTNKSNNLFVVTCIITTIFLSVANINIKSKLTNINTGNKIKTIITNYHPCTTYNLSQSANIDRHYDLIHTNFLTSEVEIKNHILDEINVIYTRAEQGVDLYLDWYFSLPGEYTRLYNMAQGNMEDLLLTSFKNKVKMYVDIDYELSKIVLSINEKHNITVTETTDYIHNLLYRSSELNYCERELFNRYAAIDIVRSTSSITLGAGVGSAVFRSSYSHLLAAQYKAYSEGLIKRTAKRKLASSVTSMLGGVAACSLSGPGAAACGIGAGIFTWFATDKIGLMIEESLIREDMKREIMESLKAQQDAIITELITQYQIVRQQDTELIKGNIERTFIPLRS